MSAPSSDPLSTPPVPARRRLLGGAFGVPAALALHSGGAFAASNTCMNRALEGTRTVPPVLGDASYARVPLHYVEAGASDNRKWYLSGASFDAIARSAPGVANYSGIAPSKFREVSIAGSSVTVGSKDMSPKSPPLQSSDRFLVVRFRAGPTRGTVDVLGVFDSTTSVTGTALSGSCWFSFETAARLRSL